MVRYGLTVENQNLITQKAKEKKDGVYSFRGVLYRVSAGKVTHFACGGEVLKPFGNFNVKVGDVSGISALVVKKMLKALTD